MLKAVMVMQACLWLSGVVCAQVSDVSPEISGSRIETNDETGEATVHHVALKLKGTFADATLVAPLAKFTVLPNRNVTSVQFNGISRILHKDYMALVEDAAYYPESGQITGKSIRISPVERVVFDCRGGIIFQDGVSSGQSSMCYGTNLLSCTGTGGNRIRFFPRAGECQ